MSSDTLKAGFQTALIEPTYLTETDPAERYDVVIQFLSAEGLPKHDVFSKSDAYFIARIDEHVTYRSSIVRDDSSPTWKDEEWTVRNIPATAKLFIGLFDKDVVVNSDDYIGQFEILDLINYQAPSGGQEIFSPKGKPRGHFHLKVQATESSQESKKLPKYTFDGPNRYFRHDSKSVGRLAKVNHEHVYSVWAITMRRVPAYFSTEESYHWDENYKPGRKIFGPSPLTVIWRDTIKLAHKALYEKTLSHTESGRLNGADDLWKLIFSDKDGKRLKPCVYTYVIDESTWRFSETRDDGFTHFISKHAVLVKGVEYVLYAGEFHIRPKNGWDKPDEEWELVIDNGSGTYAPKTDQLDKLKELFLLNFPGLNILACDFDDPAVKESKKQLEKVCGN